MQFFCQVTDVCIQFYHIQSCIIAQYIIQIQDKLNSVNHSFVMNFHLLVLLLFEITIFLLRDTHNLLSFSTPMPYLFFISFLTGPSFDYQSLSILKISIAKFFYFSSWSKLHPTKSNLLILLLNLLTLFGINHIYLMNLLI